MIKIRRLFTIRNSSCGKVMFYRCLSVHMGGRCTSPLGRHPQGRPPRQNTPQAIHPPETATAADGTHPTGMHSCLLNEYNTRNKPKVKCIPTPYGLTAQSDSLTTLNLWQLTVPTWQMTTGSDRSQSVSPGLSLEATIWTKRKWYWVDRKWH